MIILSLEVKWVQPVRLRLFATLLRTKVWIGVHERVELSVYPPRQ